MNPITSSSENGAEKKKINFHSAFLQIKMKVFSLTEKVSSAKMPSVPKRKSFQEYSVLSEMPCLYGLLQIRLSLNSS